MGYVSSLEGPVSLESKSTHVKSVLTYIYIYTYIHIYICEKIHVKTLPLPLESSFFSEVSEVCRDGLRVLGSLEECAEAGFHLGLLAAGEAGSLPGKLPAKNDGSIIHEIKKWFKPIGTTNNPKVFPQVAGDCWLLWRLSRWMLSMQGMWPWRALVKHVKSSWFPY